MNEMQTQTNLAEKITRVMPYTKFIFLTTITFGIYEMIWAYENWSFLKKEKNLNIWPFWRALLSPLFMGSLAGHVQRYLKEKNYSHNYSSVVIGISYFLLNLLWQLPYPLWLLSIFTFVPLLFIIDGMNKHWEKEETGRSLQKWAGWEIILAIVGSIIFLSSMISLFVS